MPLLVEYIHLALPARGGVSRLLAQLCELVDRCLRGDQSAMADLVAQYQPRVYALCYRMLGHHQDAEDVTQQTFVRVLKNLGRWDQQREFEPWLFAIAGNRCRTALSMRSKRWRVQTIAEPVVDPTPCKQSADNLAEELELAMQTLRPEYQTVFRMFHQQELSCEEIAERLGRPVGTVKTWIHRARIELIRFLQQRGALEAGSGKGMNHAVR